MKLLSQTDADLYLKMIVRLRSRSSYSQTLLAQHLNIPTPVDVQQNRAILKRIHFKVLLDAYLKENSYKRFSL